MIIYVWIVCLLFMGFLLLFGRMRWLEKLWELLHRTREGMDRASQLRAVENRHRLMEFQQKNNVWYRIEEVLRYSGLRRRMAPFYSRKMGCRKCTADCGCLRRDTGAWVQNDNFTFVSDDHNGCRDDSPEHLSFLGIPVGK